MSQSMLAIKNKLGSANNNLRSYAAARGLSIPDSMLEFDSWLNGGIAYLTIYNDFTNGNITNVTVNGVQVDGITFPITVGNNAAGTTSETGASQTVIVYYSSVSPSPSNILVTATDAATYCNLAAGNSSRTFTGIALTTSGVWRIEATPGAC